MPGHKMLRPGHSNAKGGIILGLSTYLEGKWLTQAQGTAYDLPATMYLLLSTTPITSSPSGTTGVTEPSGGSYARVAITSNATDWSVSGAYPTLLSNAVEQTFPQATASWGTIVSVALADASTAGNILFYGRLNTVQTDAFNGTGSQTAFTTSNPVSGDLTVDAVAVSVGGTAQAVFTDYGIEWNANGTVTINFVTAPPSGTGNVTLQYQRALAQDVPNGGLLSFPAGKLRFGLY